MPHLFSWRLALGTWYLGAIGRRKKRQAQRQRRKKCAKVAAPSVSRVKFKSQVGRCHSAEDAIFKVHFMYSDWQWIYLQETFKVLQGIKVRPKVGSGEWECIWCTELHLQDTFTVIQRIEVRPKRWRVENGGSTLGGVVVGVVEEEVTLSEWEFAISAFSIILLFTGRHLWWRWTSD